ncbi:P-II family nitrogen regulator [Candidatus Contendibacter odensensis]|uniref:Nitrogen regulatory protein P-II n=1 Tax=Candidatus Contendobacter odensis Run_B_J11 TaxID=1400861 RepID=A0A7U7GFD6_9GAMM|nr:P-II family nitrogen regulator [Candidatus Contendobacter odensis]MBK8751345.1 transcriptional regulator [Candidatus Competibacteraceae bacterium]CDH47382.1 putative Nitrogen regulatory protein P-II [Candidatus Contendobacter odensis Run_B_J11]
MQPVKRIEIIMDSTGLGKVAKTLENIGVSGYTVIRDVTGSGDRGIRPGDEITDVFKNTYVMTACPAEKVSQIVEAIRPILKRFGGVCLVSDALWIIH